jgi:1-acyl-sn-glycerol-3-phosphate acyltransferase
MKISTSPSKLKIIICSMLLIVWILLMVSLFFLSRGLGIGHPDRLINFFHKGVSRLFNLEVQYEGELCTGRPVIYACNHISYLDVFLLGAIIPGSFIAKSEVAGWPVFGKLAKLQNTLFFERNTLRAASQVAQMQDHLIHKSNLILFPEGTSTPGTHIEAFRSSLFQAADMPGENIQIQPITIAYTHYDNIRMDQKQRDYYAWYIPMPFLSHFLNCLCLGRAQTRLIFPPTVTLDQFESRKACAKHCEKQVRTGLLSAIDETNQIRPKSYLDAVGHIV